MPNFSHWLRRIQSSKAARNAGSSYFAFVSTSACALFSIPIATFYLKPEEIGLWSIVSAVVSYLVWMDLGIGDATGRKIASAIATQDQTEINRWWTASVSVLMVLGLCMIGVALLISPFLPRLLNLGESMRVSALWLFLGSAVLSGLAMPLRAYPGVLLAQERFHWVPLTQAFMPWIQLLGFWLMLRMGYGVQSYFWATLASNGSAWLLYLVLVHGGPGRFEIDRSGLTRERFGSLFEYGGSIALNGLAAAILGSLPAMMLARLGGLALVPAYSFTSRGPGLVNMLARRTTQAFYPNLQKLYVTGDRERFRLKYREVNLLSVAVSLAAAGGVLAFNRSLISWLAHEQFFTGQWSNTWFAVGTVITPLAGGLVNLLQYSGNMGKVAWFTMLQTVIGIVLGIIAYLAFGIAGLAAAFVCLPLLQGTYGLIRGSRNCGFNPINLSGTTLVMSCGAILTILLAGVFISQGGEARTAITILGRATTLPGPRELTVGAILIAAGLLLMVRQVRRLKNI